MLIIYLLFFRFIIVSHWRLFWLGSAWTAGHRRANRLVSSQRWTWAPGAKRACG